jgi:DNA-binding SARP family transcriptional activator/Tfp pilus assembly protein PilF/TolB-like protein
MTSIQLFGGVLLRRDSSVLTGPPVQRHRIGLLALLAATWPQPVTRDRAMALLWPDRDNAQSRRLLNLAVHVLRRAIGERTIVSVADNLLFDPAGSNCDVQLVRAAVGNGDAEQVARWYGGVFLEGFHLPGSPDFDSWLSETRAELARACVDALERQIDRHRADGDLQGSVECCRRLVALDPYSSSRTIRLMESLAEAGDRAAAVRSGREHVRRLREELDLEPDSSVTSLLERLRSSPGGEREAEPPGAATPSRRRLFGSGASPESVPGFAGDGTPRARPLVAMPPFQEAAGAEDRMDRVLQTDLYDRVLTRLVGSRLLRVAATTGHGVRLVGDRSGTRPRTDALIEASVRMHGQAVRASVRIVDAETGVFLGAERFESPATALDVLAEQIVEAVTSSLRGEVAARARPARATPHNEEAEALCAKGQHFCSKREESALRKAIACFEQARNLAPGFIPAHTGLANAFAILGFYDLLPPREAFSRAKQEARTALALDPARGDSHVSLGYVTKYFDWKWDDAEREFRDAISLDPSNSLAHQWYGNYLALRGRGQESIESMRRAVRLAPSSEIANAATGWAHYFAGEYHRAVDHCLESLELDPNFPVAHLWLGQAYEELGRHDEALATLGAAVPLASNAAAFRAAHAYALARAGARESAEGLLVQLLAERRTGYVPAYEIAKIHLALGRRAVAVRWLEQAFRERSHSIGFLRVDPQLIPLREEPEFEALVTRVGLL